MKHYATFDGPLKLSVRVPPLLLVFLQLAPAGTAVASSPAIEIVLPESGEGLAITGEVLKLSESSYEFYPGRFRPIYLVSIAVDSVLIGEPYDTIQVIAHNVWIVNDGVVLRRENTAGYWFKPGDLVFMVAHIFHADPRFQTQKSLNGTPTVSFVRYLLGDPRILDQETYVDGDARLALPQGRPTPSAAELPCFLQHDFRPSKKTLRDVLKSLEEVAPTSAPR